MEAEKIFRQPIFSNFALDVAIRLILRSKGRQVSPITIGIVAPPGAVGLSRLPELGDRSGTILV